jgi:hypothetical protein
MELGAESHFVVYRIDVTTGTAIGAGTDANIFCTLGGDRFRSSGEFPLEKSLLHMNKFERGQVPCAAAAHVAAFLLESIMGLFANDAHQRSARRWIPSSGAGSRWAEYRR